MANLVLNGALPMTRIVTRAGNRAQNPAHLNVRPGSPISLLAGPEEPGQDILTQGLFNGFHPPRDTHLGVEESAVILLDSPMPDIPFGFVMPGFHVLTESRTFASSFSSAPRPADTALHGEERACVNCGLCDKKCAVDLFPQFILKAILADEIEEALSLGLLDCAECGLCSVVCPCKIEITVILKQAKHAIHKERSRS
jgi:Na+-transporting NADH:ubiquinone oxidoreductase subunit A